MARRFGMLLGLAAAGLAASAAPAAAQSRSWQVCGGNAFNTCAAVELRVVGTSVTLKVWNLSGMNSTFAGTVFTAVGFENVGSAAAVSGSLAMSGPVRPGNTPAAWTLANNKQVGGGVKLDVVSKTTTGVHDGIASACAQNGQLPGGAQLWMNPCATPGGYNDPGWITLTFSITGTWDLESTYLLVKGQNGPNGASTECITGGNNLNCMPTSVVPEPMTIVLLGSGLAGIGGARLLGRRRRREDDLEDTI